MKLQENTIVVNFTGGPGCGKSTQAAELFALLKKAGVECELINEFAKEKVWDEAFKTMDDQFYLFAKQYHRQWRLQDKVDVIITDSPLMLSIIYNKLKSDYFDDLVVEQFHMFDNMNYFLSREGLYNPVGRNETFEEATGIDERLHKLYTKYNIPYVNVSLLNASGKTAAEQVFDDIKKNRPEVFPTNPPVVE